MGGLVSAPLSAAATLLGGCCGSCVATGCCQLAASGTVSSAKAARCVLLWVQAFAVVLAVLAAYTADSWLTWSCDHFSKIGLAEVGICECNDGSQNGCWRDQVIYRGEASALLVFIGLMLMAVSGCATSAARTHSVLKFMAVFVLGFVFLFVPNDVFDAFGTVATGASAIFLVAQSILLIDFAYTLNETWYARALAVYRRDISTTGYRSWIAAIIVTSAALFLGSIIFSAHLFLAYQNTGGRIANIMSVVLCLLLTLVSITDWCEHGALLTSAVVMAYSTYLVWMALAVLPDEVGPAIPVWISLTICAVSLIASTRGASVETSPASSQAPRESPATPMRAAEEGAAGTGTAEEARAEAPAEGDIASSDAKDFIIHCAVHAAAAIFVASCLAPRVGQTTFALRVVAVFASLGLYGWSLVAPKVLTGRSFG